MAVHQSLYWWVMAQKAVHYWHLKWFCCDTLIMTHLCLSHTSKCFGSLLWSSITSVIFMKPNNPGELLSCQATWQDLMKNEKNKNPQDSHAFFFSKWNFDSVALAYIPLSVTHYLFVKKSKSFANVSRISDISTVCPQRKHYPADCRDNMNVLTAQRWVPFHFTSSSTLKTRAAREAKIFHTAYSGFLLVFSGSIRGRLWAAEMTSAHLSLWQSKKKKIDRLDRLGK